MEAGRGVQASADATTIRILRLADRPDLRPGFRRLTDVWPPFMLEDPVADLFYSRLEDHPDTVFIAVDGDDEVVARALCVPFAMGPEHDRPDLPVSGWDGVVRWAWLDVQAGREPTHVSALEIAIAPAARGSGLAGRLVGRMREAARGLGAEALVAPVRPSRKHEEPLTPMAEYAARTRGDGLPVDPWLRLHVRVGGRIVGVCPTSMVIAGSLGQWREWTGLPFDTSGPVVVPGALVPVDASVEHDRAVYVEPNVWVRHPVR